MNNKKLNAGNKRLLFFVCLLFAGAITMIGYLAVTGNTPQIYRDIVNEFTAMDGSNKSAERTLFYLFSVLGAFVYAVFYLTNSRHEEVNESKLTERKNNAALYVVLGLLIFLGAYFIIYSGISWLLISAFLFAVILYAIDPSLVVCGTTFLFVCLYAVCSIYRIYAFCGGKKPLSMMAVVLISLSCSAVPLIKCRKKSGEIYLRGILLLQPVVPFSMLIYLASTYKKGEEYIKIHIPYRIQILIFLLIVFFVVEALIKIRKKWHSAIKLEDIITNGTCIAIMSFNRYSGTGSIIPSDLHHPFESIIGYSQIVELGQKAFSEYTPVSGMYSVVHGFFLSIFGHGNMSFYYLTTNLFYLAAIVLIVLLLKQQIKAEWVLGISLIFTVKDYNRITLILPIMLLLSWPKLIGKKNLWLKAWYLTSFLHGLYYPVFGAAVCLGFFPLGIWQVVSYAKSGELKADIKRMSFWVWWILCNVPVALGFKALLGTVKHMKAMGGQTIYADGITRFGQAVPEDFFPWLPWLSARLITYYMFSFLIVISIVWVSVALCLKVGNVKLRNRRILMGDPVPGFISLSFGIALLVAFSYTVIRMDIGYIYSRSEGMVYASFVIIAIIVGRYMAKEKNQYVVFAFAIFIVSVVSGEGFMSVEANSKLEAYYTVPEDYVYVVDDRVEKLGECFVEQSVYDVIENSYDYTLNVDKNESYLGLVPFFGQFYLCNVKGDSVMEFITIKGYDAAQEAVDLIRENNTIVGSNMSSINNYYLYHWMVTSGEYIWKSDKRIFVPNDGSMTRDEILLQNKNIDISAEGASLGRTAGSWGKSMNTLDSIFSNVQAEYRISPSDSGVDISFGQSIMGEDADFIYINFSGVDQNYQYMLYDHGEDELQDMDQYPRIKYLMKKDYNRGISVVITWMDEEGNEHSMNCQMEQGELLLPLGAGRGWLLNNHSDIKVSVMQGNENLAVPEIVSFRLLKLREVE